VGRDRWARRSGAQLKGTFGEPSGVPPYPGAGFFDALLLQTTRQGAASSVNRISYYASIPFTTEAGTTPVRR
jgi:hypothetical protein